MVFCKRWWWEEDKRMIVGKVMLVWEKWVDECLLPALFEGDCLGKEEEEGRDEWMAEKGRDVWFGMNENSPGSEEIV